MTERMFTPNEVAGLLKITRRTIYAWIRDGRLAAVKIGTRVRVEASELERFVAAHRSKTA